jgi:hypothetical protein
MDFALSINMDNAAFADPYNGSEVARILRELADRIDGKELTMGEWRPLQDINGNRVGAALVEAAE